MRYWLRLRPLRAMLRVFLRWRRFARNSELTLVGIVAVTALAIGLLTAGLHAIVLGLHAIAFGLPPGVRLSAVPHDPSSRLLIVPMLGAVVLGLTRRFMKFQAVKQVIDPIEANALRGGQMSLRDSGRLITSTLVSNASGASVGMEAGYTQLGAALLSAVGNALRLRREEMRTFVSAGAAAAIAAAFNAPLAGAFYGFEVVQGRYTVRSLAPVALAALVGALVVRFLGAEALFTLPELNATLPWWVYAAGVVLGVGAAYIAILTMWSATLFERILKDAQIPNWVRPAIGAAMVGLLATASPQVLGSGQGAIEFHLHTQWPWAALLVLLLAKVFASSLSLGAGFRGGLFSCSLMLGCVFGGTFAGVLESFSPVVMLHETAFKLMGMAAVGAGIIGAPLTMALLVLETTQNFGIAIAVVAGATIASMIVRIRFGYSFATWRFHLRGLPISGAEDVGWLNDLKIARLMLRNPPVAYHDESIAAVRARFPLGVAERVFVVDRANRYVGMLDVALIHTAEAEEALRAAIALDLAEAGERFLLATDGLGEAMRRFELWRAEQLAVVGDDTRTLVGHVSEALLLKRYADELGRGRSDDLRAPVAPVSRETAT